MLLADDGGKKPGGGGDTGRRRHVSDQTPVRPGRERGAVTMDLLDEMDKKLLKSLLNEGWRGDPRRGEDCDGGEKTRVKSPLNETKTRGGKSRRAEDRPRKQDSRFERSMRVLEWLDADCGTRLARHYEQAGGWRQHGNIYLPQRSPQPRAPPQQQPQQQHQLQQPHQTRQPLRLTRSNIIVDTDLWYGYVKDSEEDSSSDPEKKVLEESDEDFVNEADGDDEDIVLALKKWQDEQLLQEHYEDLSMQEYVTSSEDDENADESDSEDELVLALRHWQEEQQRQQQLQQQFQRQASVAQVPSALTPVLEEKVTPPSNDAFKYFYQDPNYLVCHFNRQRLTNPHNIPAIAPYWWGDISSVREGPSSPPVNAQTLDTTATKNILGPQRRGSRNAASRARGRQRNTGSSNVSGSKVSSNVGSKESEVSAKIGQVSADQSLLFLPTPPVGPLLVSPTSSSQLLPTFKSEGGLRSPVGRANKVPSPTPLDSFSGDSKSGGVLDTSAPSKVTGAAAGKFGEDSGPKTGGGAVSPHPTLISKTSSGGSFLSSWLGNASGDKQSSQLISACDNAAKSGEVTESQREHKLVTSTFSTASQDSGIERSPGYLSPAPRSAGIEKLGKFFRHFSNKLSPAVGGSSSTSPKTQPPTPTTPGRQQYYPQQQVQQQQQQSLKIAAGAVGKLSLSTSSIPNPTSSHLLKPLSPSPVAGFAAQHAICSATRSDPLATSTVPKRHAGLWWSGQQQHQFQQQQQLQQQQNNNNSKDAPRTHLTALTTATVNNAGGDNSCSFSAGGGTGEGGAAGGGGRFTADDVSAGNNPPATPIDRKGAPNIDTSTAAGCGGDRLKSPGGPNSNIGKALVGGGRETQPFVVPQAYQSQHLHAHQYLTVKRSAGEINKKSLGAETNDGADQVESGDKSASRYFFKDNADSLRKCNEGIDGPSGDNETLSGAGTASAVNSTGFGGFTRAAQQILRRSPVSDIEQKIHSDSVERDPQGKFRTVASAGGLATSGGGASEGAGGFAGGAPQQAGSGDYSSVPVVRSMTDSKKKGAVKEELVSSRRSERSSSTSSDEKGTLPVPEADRGRRGSYGTCNHLFIEQATGRKSPLPQKVRKSPSPVRRALFKSVVNSSSNSSSSSSADSSSKQKAGRILSSSSPSSPPPYLSQQPSDKSSPLKTSPKHQITHPYGSGLDSPTKKTISDAPPANYRGRRKFSDTGLTPVPRRLFSDGRRGSLTDERTLVSAKSKLGRLRFQGRKSSDASSVAALVKQIHNLWGDGDEEEGGDSAITPAQSGTGLSCSLDDQALCDKRRKKFPFHISKDKDSGGGGGGEGKLGNKINCTPKAVSDVSPPMGCGLGWDARRKFFDKDASQPLQLVSTPSAHNPSSVDSTGDACCQTPDQVNRCAPNDTSCNDATTSGPDAVSAASGGAGVIGTCGGAVGGSEFVAPIAQVASRQLVATAVSSAACFVGLDSPDSLLQRASATTTTAAGGSQTTGTNTTSSATTNVKPSPNNTIIVAGNIKSGKKTATVQFQPIVSWDDNTVGEKVSPALKSVLKQGARRHSSFAGFSDSCDSISNSSKAGHSEQLAAVLNKQAKNGLPKSKTSDNYKSILKQSSVNIDPVTSSPPSGEKKRAKSPSPKSRKNEKGFDYSPDTKNSEISLSLCLKATRSLSPKSKKSRGDELSTDQSCQVTPLSSTDREQLTDSGNCSLDLPTKTVGVQATPRTIGKTSNTGTQTTDLPVTGEVTAEFSSSPPEGAGWLQRLAAKCMASVGGASRSGSPGGPGGGGLPRAASVRAEWLLGSKRMGSSPSSPVAPGSDASEKFWVPHDVIARKRAQSLVPSLSKQESEDDLSSEAATPATIPHPRDLAFTFPTEKAGTSGGSSDGQPSTPPSGYNPGRRRASMHDDIDLTKIDTRLYDKKLVRQASVTSIEEESQGTVHVSLEHNLETSILTVNLVRAHNLLPRDLCGTANPYCRLTLLPGHRASAQSRIHRKTLNPEFEEEFIFELTPEEVDESTLELSFYEYDQFSKDECVGYVRIPLCRMDLSKQVDLWRSIAPYEKPKDQRDLGDVMFSLSYLPSAERLTVVIVKARNLRLQDDVKVDLNTFIKVCLMSGHKKIKKKKTSTAHGTNSPTWNEALVFSVHRENLKLIGLEVSAYHDNKIGVDECIGRVRLAPDSEDGVHCQELLKEKNTPARWYCLNP